MNDNDADIGFHENYLGVDFGDDDLFNELVNHGQQRREDEHDRQPEVQDEGHANIDLDVEFACDADALFDQLVTVDRGPSDLEQGTPSESNAATLAGHMFGPVRDLQHIGSSIQKKCFTLFIEYALAQETLMRNSRHKN